MTPGLGLGHTLVYFSSGSRGAWSGGAASSPVAWGASHTGVVLEVRVPVLHLCPGGALEHDGLIMQHQDKRLLPIQSLCFTKVLSTNTY